MDRTLVCLPKAQKLHAQAALLEGGGSSRDMACWGVGRHQALNKAARPQAPLSPRPLGMGFSFFVSSLGDTLACHQGVS